MHFLILLFVGLTIKQSLSKPRQSLKDNVKVLDRDIDEINQGLNLIEGDILKIQQRSTISDTQYRWETPVPYTFDAGLDVNAKGVILRAFDQFGLKSCIDFKLRDTEQNYISFQDVSGCSSYVGNNHVGEQILSIGQYCDHIDIVEHELLHALGFFHEHSRYDRDNYVTIVWENILKVRKVNFKKALENETTTHGTPYDYNSVMHYDQFAFGIGNRITIITKLPEFQNKIGQRLDMSHYDAVELNSLYNCTSSVAFLARCSFENGTCQMSRCSRGNASWSSETFTPGGPESGHTNLGVFGGLSTVPSNASSTPAPTRGPSRTPSNESSTSAPYNSTGADFFMHFSTAKGVEGDGAKMDTQKMTPRRNCAVQCLQFYYYHSGNESDRLNIWMREFDDEYDTGTRRLMWQITGPPADYWQLQHVPLNATKTFQVEFEGQKGEGSSFGGFSVDDINLSETECPHQTWQIRNVEELIAANTVLHSPRYFSKGGYGYRIQASLNPDYTEVYVRLVSGENASDYQLQWPCPYRQITIQILDQHPDIQQRMSRQFSFTTDPTSPSSSMWDNPRKVGTLFNDSYGESYYVNRGYGANFFGTLEVLRDSGFVKGGDIFVLVNMQDISELHFNRSLECNTMLPPQDFSSDRADDGPCVPVRVATEAPPTTETSSSIKVFSSVFVILVALALLWSP
ncbi:hypothetical protein SKAU_G00223540 [Synaphobranchus kaupii]|uniref:Metalloendopeptidase n=1 Tax=Synaphobranchus kaupii TaxID=118154 RepID=A0A9Q1FBE8_SYNKA|nr:hypothetical protein SKAU_G00223540 [Synaphobranchus kaupii]